jgi:hypothetical protein
VLNRCTWHHHHRHHHHHLQSIVHTSINHVFTFFLFNSFSPPVPPRRCVCSCWSR